MSPTYACVLIMAASVLMLCICLPFALHAGRFCLTCNQLCPCCAAHNIHPFLLLLYGIDAVTYTNRRFCNYVHDAPQATPLFVSIAEALEVPLDQMGDHVCCDLLVQSLQWSPCDAVFGFGLLEEAHSTSTAGAAELHAPV